MGAYYGIKNHTKKQSINSYQKNEDYSNDQLNTFAHAFNWKPNDAIITASYNDMNVRYFCSDSNSWKTVDMNSDVEPNTTKPNDSDQATQYSGESGSISEQYEALSSNHFPVFDENGKCTHCGLHVLSDTELEKCAASFSDVFFMN